MIDAQLQGLSVGGVLTLGTSADSETSQLIANWVGGEHLPLAERADLPPTFRGPQTFRWRFRQETLDTLNQRFRGMGYVDWLIVDELGPLEFEQGEGFMAAFDVLDQGNFGEAFVVVRPKLLPHARQRWPHAKEVRIGPGN